MEATITSEKLEKGILEFFSLEELEKNLTNYSRKLKSASGPKALEDMIRTDFVEICTTFMAIADHAFQKETKKLESLEYLDKYVVNYSLPPSFKDLIILHRDVFLELFKANIQSSESLTAPQTIEEHFQSSKQVLIKATEYFINYIGTEKKNKTKRKNSEKKILEKLNLYNNPWPTYNKQFDTLLKQINNIDAVSEQLFSTAQKFVETRKLISRTVEHHSNLHQKLSLINRTILDGLNGKNDPDGLLHLIDHQIEVEENSVITHESLVDEVDLTINKLQRITVPVASQEGLLVVKELNLYKTVQKWLDHTILPDFMSLIMLEKKIKNEFRIALANIKNSVLLNKKTGKIDNYEAYAVSMSFLQKLLDESKNNGGIISGRILEKVNGELLVSNLFNNTPFLEVSMNSTIVRNKNSILKRIKDYYRKSHSYFSSEYRKRIYQNSFTSLENTTKCIAHRMLKEENEHYDTLFLNKNFIGDLFLIPREHQEQKLKHAIDIWQKGFNKSVLVTGDRLSGRTTFMDYTSKKYFGKHIVTLKPNSSATIDGRKFATTFNLKDALQYIKNNNLKSTRPAILIDDLEVWWDHETNLLENIRALTDFIENEADDAFVIVSITNALDAYLENRLKFSGIFDTKIDVSYSEKQQILNAILLRHGATNRVLVTEDLTVVSEEKIKRTAYKLCKKYENNIGDVLQAWSYNTFVHEGDKVLFREAEDEFMDFFTQEELILLKQASLYRNISEIGLKKVIAFGFDQHFHSALKRMMNTKILLRDSTGILTINPVILNDVNRLLERKNILI